MSTMKFTSWQDLDGNEVANSAYPPGLVLVKSQTIGTAVSSVTVNDAFSSRFDQYMVRVSGVTISTTSQFSFRLASGGTASTSNYRNRLVYNSYDSSTPLGAVYSGSEFTWLGGSKGVSGLAGMAAFEVMQPYLSTFTYIQSMNYGADTTGGHSSGVHQIASSYDSFVFITDLGTMSGGTIRVYGYNQ